AAEIARLGEFIPAQRGLSMQKDHKPKPTIKELMSIFNQHDGDEDLVANDDEETDEQEGGVIVVLAADDEEDNENSVPNPPRWLTTNQPAHRERILLRANRERAELDAAEMARGVPSPPRVI